MHIKRQKKKNHLSRNIQHIFLTIILFLLKASRIQKILTYFQETFSLCMDMFFLPKKLITITQMHVNNKGQIFKSVFFTIDFLNWLLWSLNVKSIVKCIRKLLANKYFKFFYAIHLYIIWPLYAELFLKMTILFFLFHVAIFFKKM